MKTFPLVTIIDFEAWAFSRSESIHNKLYSKFELKAQKVSEKRHLKRNKWQNTLAESNFALKGIMWFCLSLSFFYSDDPE